MAGRTAWRPDPTAKIPSPLLRRIFKYDPSMKEIWDEAGIESQYQLAKMGLKLNFAPNKIKDILLVHRRERNMDLKLENRNYYDQILKKARWGLEAQTA